MEFDQPPFCEDDFDQLLANLFPGSAPPALSPATTSSDSTWVGDSLQPTPSGSSQSGDAAGPVLCLEPAPPHGRKTSSKAVASSKPLRFRQRQKQEICTLQQCLEQIHQQAVNLAAANEQLRVKNKILAAAIDAQESLAEGLVAARNETLLDVQRVLKRNLCCTKTPEVKAQFQKIQQTAMVLSGPELIANWKAYVKAALQNLLQAETDPEAQAKQLELCFEIGATVERTAATCPDAMRMLMSVNVEENRPEFAHDSHWAKVVAYLELTPEQVQEALALLSLNQRTMNGILQKRQLMTPSLPQVMQSSVQLTSLYDAISCTDAAELNKQLLASLNQEYGACFTINSIFLGKILNGPQFTRAAICSYPYFPDALAILNVVAEMAQQSSSIPSIVTVQSY